MGKPSKAFRDSHGIEHFGLAHDTDKRYRISLKGHPKFGFKWTAPHEQAAIARFYELIGQEKTVLIPPTQGDRHTLDLLEADQIAKVDEEVAQWVKEAHAKGQSVSDDEVTFFRRLRQNFYAQLYELLFKNLRLGNPNHEQALWAYFAQELMADREKVAKLTGISALAHIDPNQLPRPSVKLADLVTAYDLKSITPAARYRARKEVERLQKITGAKTLADLTKETLIVYRKEIERIIPGAGTRETIYGKIKAVLVNGIGDDAPFDEKEITTVLARCAVLKVNGDKPVPKPNPISREHLHILLQHAVGDYYGWRAIILTALNCCLSVDETARLEWEDFELPAESKDFAQAVYQTTRNKTREHELPRAAVLWNETTVELHRLRKSYEVYTQTTPGGPLRYRGLKTPHLFISSHGTRWTTNALCKNFTHFRREVCGIPDEPKGTPSLSFQGFRDGAYTTAVKFCSNKPLANILAGHKQVHHESSYVRIDPHMVRPASDAVYQYYGPFPPPTAS